MKQVYLEVVNQDSCNASIRGAERKVPYLLTDDMFCAGGGLGHDACSVSKYICSLTSSPFSSEYKLQDTCMLFFIIYTAVGKC